MSAPMIALRHLSPLLLTLALWSAEEPLPFPEMAPTIGTLLQRNYYDHQRFQPRLMVERALRSLERAEITIEAQWKDSVIRIRHENDQRTIQAPDPRSLEEAMILIEAVRGELDRTPLTNTRKRELTYAMLNGALATLDPHTVLMPPEPAQNFSEDVAGEFFGIGAYLAQNEGIISIERVMPGLPAERAGIEDGDVILAVDGERTAGLSLHQAVKRIKGPKGTTVSLTLHRKGMPQPIVIAVVRDLVQVVTMRAWRRDSIGYVRMDEFNANTARDLATALLELERSGPLSAFVLDLRFNPGGLLDQAKLISDFFLPAGKEIVRTVTVDGDPHITSSSRQTLLDVPMAVITSGGSASAAEILSGCLQLNDRAVVLGTTTFGKGSVQTVRPLRDNSRLKLTIQEYQLPGGVSIQDVGVTPDVRLVRHIVDKDGSVDLLPFSPHREHDEEFALANRKAYAHQATATIGWLAHYRNKDELKVHGIASRSFSPDQEAMLVLDLMAAAASQADFATTGQAAVKSGQGRRFLLDRLTAPLRERQARESAALTEALAKQPQPITWGPETAVDGLQVSFAGPAQIQAGTDADLRFTITNPSDVPAGRIFGMIEADIASPLWEDELVVGAVPARGTVEARLHFRVPPRLYAGEERFTLVLRHDGQEAPLARLPISLTVVPQERPHFAISWSMTPTILKPGEPASLGLQVLNDGSGTSAPLKLRVFKLDDAFVQLLETELPFPKGLAPGSTAPPVSVPLTIAEQVRGTPFAAHEIRLQLSLAEDFEDIDDESRTDGRYRSGFGTTLTIPVGQAIAPRSLVPPRLATREVKVDGGIAHIRIRLDDDNPRWLTILRNEDKIDLRSVTASGEFTFDVPLEPGINSVQVVAVDADTLEQGIPLRIWGAGEKPTTKPAAKAPPGNEVLP